MGEQETVLGEKGKIPIDENIRKLPAKNGKGDKNPK